MEKLYNNILLPDDFMSQQARPTDVPYLKNPPEVINVTRGRQLFVDDFLIEKTDLTPNYHKAEKLDAPVLVPETPWEREGVLPVACPKSGGVWYDEDEKIFKMWYEAGWLSQMCYATSTDGIHWDRPDLDIEPGTNKILNFRKGPGAREAAPALFTRPDSTTFWIDYKAPKEQRYKMYLRNPGPDLAGILATSADGIHWENHRLSGVVDDRTTMFYNPFREKWVISCRSCWDDKRSRRYHEWDDFLADTKWSLNDCAKWMIPDELDEPDPYIGKPAQLYNVDCVGYESIMLGMYEIHYGPDNLDCAHRGVPKITELQAMYSRDGYNFSRPHRKPIINASRYEGSWDRGYVQSAGGICVIHGDELWLYYIGYGGDESVRHEDQNRSGMYMNGCTGMAKLRRDGFVSMDGKGELLTRKLEFTGKQSLHVNAKGFVKVTLLDDAGEVIGTSRGMTIDSTNARVVLDCDVAALNGKAVRVKFEVDGQLYSFGFADENGDFGGERAAGVVR